MTEGLGYQQDEIDESVERFRTELLERMQIVNGASETVKKESFEQAISDAKRATPDGLILMHYKVRILEDQIKKMPFQ